MKSPQRPSALVHDLVLANRVLYQHQVLDGFGHVSVRHPDSPGHFLISRSMAPALVTQADVLTLDLHGQVVDESGRNSYLERFIHAAIYSARPDVHAVVHSHSPSIIPFGATQRPLRPLYHMCGFLGAGSAFFDIRAAAGDTDMLIRNEQLGVALARALGPHAIVLMRGHGSTVVGTSVQQVVYRAIYAETNARLQGQAEALGEVLYLNEEEAAAAAATGDTQMGRAWDLWVRSVGPID